MREDEAIEKAKQVQSKEKEELKKQIRDYMRHKRCCTQQELQKELQKPAKVVKEVLRELELKQRGEEYCVRGRE